MHVYFLTIRLGNWKSILGRELKLDSSEVRGNLIAVLTSQRVKEEVRKYLKQMKMETRYTYTGRIQKKLFQRKDDSNECLHEGKRKKKKRSKVNNPIFK